MKLCVSYSWEDQEIAGEVAYVCEEIGVDYTLDGRNDWLMHGLHPGPDDATHHVFIVSPTNERSWWLPFQLGRTRGPRERCSGAGGGVADTGEVSS